MRCIVSCLLLAQCDCVASVERHSDRMHVAMVAQDLVVSKQPEAFHTHDIPSVHGSGAFGLALQSNTRKSTRLSAFTFTDSAYLGFHALNLVR